MPIYCYKCSKCGSEIELLQKLDEEAPPCPNTEIEYTDGGGHLMLRQISLGSFVLSGGGWFKDGYSKKPGEKK